MIHGTLTAYQYRGCRCAKCKAAAHEAYLQWRSRNPGTVTRQARRKRAVRRWLARIKLQRGCLHCGYNKAAVALDFHHRDAKQFTISQCPSCSVETLRAEVAKCDVLCANCHRILSEER